MKKLKRFVTVVAVSLSISLSMPSCFMFPVSTVEAHSGRTDSSGGHKDNKNKSGLGNYHYHCGGNPAHLHKNGVCPYSNSASSTNSSSTNSTASTTSTSKYTYSYTAKYKSASTDYSNRLANGQFLQEIVVQMPNYSNMTVSLLSQSELEDFTYLKNEQDIDDMSKLIFIRMYDYVLSLSQQVIAAPSSNNTYDNAIFSAQYYATKYPELVTVLGNDELALYNHFLNSGMAEGRQGCATFNVQMYIMYNPDLQQVFGDDIVAYYHHYLNNGQYEGRLAY